MGEVRRTRGPELEGAPRPALPPLGARSWKSKFKVRAGLVPAAAFLLDL